MVRQVRGCPVLQIFMVKSNQALNKSAPGPAELFTIRTQQSEGVDLALSGLLNNSGLPISAVTCHRFESPRLVAATAPGRPVAQSKSADKSAHSKSWRFGKAWPHPHRSAIASGKF